MDRVSLRTLVWLAVLLGAFSSGSFVAGPLVAEEPKPAAKQDDYYELYKVFADTLDQVERNYVKNISRRELMEAAIGGVLSKLDPYSSYISPDELSRFKSSVESQFGGIGIQITIDHDQLKILSPLVGTPAYRAGLESGDSIVEIDGKGTQGVELDEAVRRLKGEAGTSVSLTVVSAGSLKKRTVTVARELIHIDTVLGDRRATGDMWDYMLDADKRIGYIRITAFSRDTAADLRKALEQLKSRGMKGLVVDLRFNPGGLLTSAIEISDLFIDKGRIVSTNGRNSPERVWDAQAEGTFLGFPMAVLVNRYSASASEIVAACLQDHQRAIIVGERTWGKGSVQNVIELEDGRSALKLTTAAYRRPSGKNIHRFPDAKDTDEWGVTPDEGFRLQLTDREMRELFRHRAQRDILRPKSEAAAEVAITAPAKTDAAPPPTTLQTTAPQAPAGDSIKTDPAKPDPANPAPVKPAAAKPPADPASPAATSLPPAAAPAGTAPVGPPAPPAAATPTAAPAVANAHPPSASPEFVDRQLQKAFDRLTAELVRAEAPAAKKP